jgi:hypothetical protein
MSETFDLREIVSRLVDERFGERLAELTGANDVEEHKRRLALINAKEYLTAREAALLLGCSDGHLRNLVRDAKKGRKRYPVPFRDLDGVITFPREDLLKWAAQPKPRLKAA